MPAPQIPHGQHLDHRNPTDAYTADERTFTYEMVLAPGWRVSARYLRLPGDEIALAEVKVFPETSLDGLGIKGTAPGAWDVEEACQSGLPDGGITSSLLRSIRLDDLAIGGLQEERSLALALDIEDPNPERTITRPGRAGRDDLYYATWANRYVCQEGRARIKALAEQYGLETSQVRDIIYQARTRGLLSKVRQGKAGGSLTDKAREVLRQAQGSTDGQR